jgi:hypothetical protein
MVRYMRLMSYTLPGPLLSLIARPAANCAKHRPPHTPDTQINKLCTIDASACRADAAAHSLQIEVGVGVAGDFLVALGVDDLLDFMVDKIIEGVNVLSN